MFGVLVGFRVVLMVSRGWLNQFLGAYLVVAI